MRNLMGGPSFQLPGPLGKIANWIGLLGQFARNPIGAILSLNNVNVPKDFNGTPQQLAQYLMNSGQMPQEQFQQFAQTANQIQSMGLFPKL